MLVQPKVKFQSTIFLNWAVQPWPQCILGREIDISPNGDLPLPELFYYKKEVWFDVKATTFHLTASHGINKTLDFRNLIFSAKKKILLLHMVMGNIEDLQFCDKGSHLIKTCSVSTSGSMIIMVLILCKKRSGIVSFTINFVFCHFVFFCYKQSFLSSSLDHENYI